MDENFILLPDSFLPTLFIIGLQHNKCGTATQDRIDIRTISSAKLFHQSQLWSATLNDQIVSTY